MKHNYAMMIDTKAVSDPEVLEQALHRVFTPPYTLRILKGSRQCTKPGQLEHSCAVRGSIHRIPLCRDGRCSKVSFPKIQVLLLTRPTPVSAELREHLLRPSFHSTTRITIIRV